MNFSPRRIAIGLVTVLLVAGVLLVSANQQLIRDQISVMQYTPTGEITTIVARTDLTEHGRFLLYAASPAIIGTQEFNDRCDSDDEGSFSVLGCYAEGEIYIYRVSEDRLDGIMDVTAVHEMLHAAWSRLSAEERARIGGLLDAEVAKREGDAALAERLAWYFKRESGSRLTELHSIVGTEFTDIDSELEQYYSGYFEDRGAVLGLFGAYQSVFEALTASSESLVAQLDALYQEIQADTSSYQSQIQALNSDIEAFNRRADNGEFASQSEFDAARAVLITRNSSLSNRYAAIEQDRSRYEALQAQLAAINAQSEALGRSLDSTLAPPAPVG